MTRTVSRRSLFAALFAAVLGVMVSGASLVAQDKCSNCSGRGGRGHAHGGGDCDCGNGHGQGCADGHCLNAGGQMPVDHGHPNLFYNFYVPPTAGGMGSSLYLSPGPTPPNVGHTYITYQPLMPHEFMYPHHKRYYRYYNGGRGLNRTHVQYYNTPVLSQAHSVLSMFRLAR